MPSQGGKSGVNLISDLPLAGPDVREVWGKSLVSSSSSSVSLYSFLFLALLDSLEGVAVLDGAHCDQLHLTCFRTDFRGGELAAFLKKNLVNFSEVFTTELRLGRSYSWSLMT